MKIRIGADELILWLRKNKKALEKSNPTLGKEILSKIEILGGKKLEIEEAHWANKETDKNIGEFKLPKDAHQYEIEINQIVEVYKWLDSL